MIKPDNFEIVIARVALAAQQLRRFDQKPVPLRTLLARVRDRIRFLNNFALIAVAPKQQPATLVRIILHTVCADLTKRTFWNRNHADNACSMSAIMSSIFSMPTEMRTSPSTIPH